MSMFNRDPPIDNLWAPWWIPNYLSSNLRISSLESIFGVSIDHLIPLKRLSGNEPHSSERILNILNNFNSETIKEESVLELLLQSCGRVLLDESFSARSELCDKVWEKLEECGIKFSVRLYNIYLQNCIDNRKQINFSTFLDSMSCEPNQDTLRLLLECSCENGDAKQAADVLQEMRRRSYTADSKLFNTLLLGYAANGGLIKAEQFFNVLTGIPADITFENNFELLRGLALYNKEEEFYRFYEMFQIKLQDHNYFDLLLTLGCKGNHSWLTRVQEVFGPLKISQEDIQPLTLLCKQLIYLNQSDSAIFYYKLFVKPLAQDDGQYAFTLLEDMVFSKTPVEKIIMFIDDLEMSNLNILVFEKLTTVALRNNNDEIALKLMKNRFNVLKPINFWPILTEFGQEQGEIGIFLILKKMIEWEVKPECETLAVYCIPFCVSNNYQDLYTRMQNLGFTNRELFPPFLRFFLEQTDVSACLKLCKKSRFGAVSVEQFLKPLVRTWIYTENNNNIAEILQYISKMAIKPLDYSGKFLFKALQSCETLLNHQKILDLLKVMKSKNMFVSFVSVQSWLYIFKNSNHQLRLIEAIKQAINQITHVSMDKVHTPIPHSYDRTLEGLESALIELRQNDVDTQRILTRLIMYHCKLCNEKRVQELRQEYQDSGYIEIPGIKSCLMKLYVMKENLVDAINTYKDLQNFSSNFIIDESKIIDLAALLVKNNQFDAALKILEDEARKREVQGGESLVKNCGLLLESANDELEMKRLFECLLEKGYCEVCSTVLGPFVKFYIKSNNLNKAVEMFKDYVNKHNCTPQKFELLCQVLKVQNKKLTEEVYSCIVKVHKSKKASELLISALAQIGFTESLRRKILEYKLNLKHMVKSMCGRLISARNLQSLETFAEAAWELPLAIIDPMIIYNSIIKVHSKNNDCESAVKFYRKLVEKDEKAAQSLLYDLLQLTNRCKYKMPDFM